MVLDAEGNPSVAYAKRRSLYTYRLKFAYRDSLGRHPDLVDSLGGGDCALGVDTLGQPCIAHCESWSSGAMFYSERTDSGWVTDSVLPDNASQSKLALDRNGDPHISFFWADGSAYDLRFAERIGGEWRTVIVDPGRQSSKRGWDNWIVRDATGTYHIPYHAHNDLQLRYAHGTYGDWETEVVNAVGGWYLGSSIDLDELGRPVIAYCHENQAYRLYLSAAYDLTGIEEPATQRPMPGRGMPTMMSAADFARIRGRVLDTQGRVVTARKAGLSPGVYFLLEEGRQSRGFRRTVVTR